MDPKTGKGTVYRGIVDCALKIFRTEGVRGFYKGFSASFLRLGPHTVLSIFFWQLLRKEYIVLVKRSEGEEEVEEKPLKITPPVIEKL